MNYFFILISVLFVSCGPKENSPKEVEIGLTSLSFELDSLVREKCSGESCARIRLVWPVAKGGEVANLINDHIQKTVCNLMEYGEKESTDMEAGAEVFLEEYLNFQSEFPEFAGEWEIQVEGEVVYSSDQTLSIQFFQYTYLGGAHPNSMVYFLNLNSDEGKILERDQLILKETELLKLTEEKFRAFHEVAEEITLEEDGRFFLPETGFFLANAMGFHKDKFKVIYIPYEIGPYVMGYTELEFSKEELGDIVRW